MVQTDKSAFDVAVVGGGATGVAAALVAAEAGLRTVLFAPPASFPPGRTAALLDGSMRLLDALGVTPALADCAEPLKAIRLIDATRRLIRAPETTFYASEIGLAAFGYNIPNGDLVTALRRQAEGVDNIELVPSPVQSVSLGGARGTLETDDASYTAKLIVAADGARSLVREAAGINVRTWSYPQTALVATLTVQHHHGGVSTEFHTERGPFTLVPLPGNRVSLVWVDTPKAADRAIEMDDDALARTIEARAHSIHGAMQVESRPASVRLRAALADRFAASGTVLVGETAHLFPPIGAQGLNLGFRDVAALQRMLARHRDDPGGADAIRSFHAMRQADVRSRTYAVDLLNRSLLTDFLPVQAGRALGISVAGALPPLRRLLMRQGVTSHAGA